MNNEYEISINVNKCLIDEDMKKDIKKIKEHFKERNIKLTTKDVIRLTIQIGLKWHIRDQLKTLTK